MTSLDLGTLPPIFVSHTHFDEEELHEFEDELVAANASLTYDIREAKFVLSKAEKKRRIQLDLRSKGLWTEEVSDGASASRPRAKRLRSTAQLGPNKKTDVVVLDDSSTASEGEHDDAGRAYSTKTKAEKKRPAALLRTPSPTQETNGETIKVIRVEWFEKSKSVGKMLPLEDYLSYEARKIDKPAETTHPATPTNSGPVSVVQKSPSSQAILTRAKEDAPAPSRLSHFTKRKFNSPSKSNHGTGGSWERGHNSAAKHPRLLEHHTTSDREGSGQSSNEGLPEMPDWVKQGVKYACQRSTPAQSPNEAFIKLLKRIRVARELTNDQIGVRAYSTSIASLAAYPHKLSSPREIQRLPGCNDKIANLFVEWKNTGTLKAIEDIEASEDLTILKLFYDIWGVGATTARDFFYDRGWKELDDVVEFGWSILTRVQQIGVKYYDEFQDLIPKAEVEEIARTIHRHAVKVRDDKIQSMIVGGYRRGKEASGDVDVIVSHPDENQTLNIVNDIQASLEEEGWITHTLLLSDNTSSRSQQTLPFRSAGGGHGFDSLDKALVVWQDPSWPSKDKDLAENPKAKNPNIHRRVDIIISPWRTVGCAVMGWSGGTTFQRDLRRYAKAVKGWKFDSSGVRSQGNGEVVDLEGWGAYSGKIGSGRAQSMIEAEKRVFEGMELVYRQPWERCTG